MSNGRYGAPLVVVLLTAVAFTLLPAAANALGPNVRLRSCGLLERAFEVEATPKASCRTARHIAAEALDSPRRHARFGNWSCGRSYFPVLRICDLDYGRPLGVSYAEVWIAQTVE